MPSSKYGCLGYAMVWYSIKCYDNWGGFLKGRKICKWFSISFLFTPFFNFIQHKIVSQWNAPPRRRNLCGWRGGSSKIQGSGAKREQHLMWWWKWYNHEDDGDIISQAGLSREETTKKQQKENTNAIPCLIRCRNVHNISGIIPYSRHAKPKDRHKCFEPSDLQPSRINWSPDI